MTIDYMQKMRNEHKEILEKFEKSIAVDVAVYDQRLKAKLDAIVEVAKGARTVDAALNRDTRLDVLEAVTPSIKKVVVDKESTAASAGAAAAQILADVKGVHTARLLINDRYPSGNGISRSL